MKDKFPEIYKNKIKNVKSKIQKEFYYHAEEDVKESPTRNVSIDKMSLLKKINNIFARPDYIYQADVIIMYKNGENKQKKIVGFIDNTLITMDNERIPIEEISDIK